MNYPSIRQSFSDNYFEARTKFLEAATRLQDAVTEAFVLPGYVGAKNEELAIDVAYLGDADAACVVILSSGTHGPEAFCGSGSQIAMLNDPSVLTLVRESGIGLLLIHAVNPYGFSHLQRTNQDNIDLCRNFIDFEGEVPGNPGYERLDPILLPESWPPDAENEKAWASYVGKYGLTDTKAALSIGQYSIPDGMFYGGRGPTWNNDTVRAILRRYAGTASHVAWIDVHTGLGPYGHGDKLFAGRRTPADMDLARECWGALTLAPRKGQSDDTVVNGLISSSIYDECPEASAALIGLEFGTWSETAVSNSLRASHWLLRHSNIDRSWREEIQQQLRDAFYCDEDEWKSMVWCQTRAAVLQALKAMAAKSFHSLHGRSAP